jgi:hypothetical protein
MYLMAQLKDGTKVVSEFSKLAKVQRYVTYVFQGVKPFNAWKVSGDSHPVSGEQVLMRERTMYNGRDILSIVQVRPTTEEHGYEPENFEPVSSMQKGGRGVYTVPEQGGPEGIEAGTQFPRHRDPRSFRDYIVLREADPEAEPHTEEAGQHRFYLDGMGAAVAGSSRSRRPWEDEDEDDGDDSGW